MDFTTLYDWRCMVCHSHAFWIMVTDPNSPFNVPGNEWYQNFRMRELVERFLKLEVFFKKFGQFVQF